MSTPSSERFRSRSPPASFGPETEANWAGESGTVAVGRPPLQVTAVPGFTFEMIVVPATVIVPYNWAVAVSVFEPTFFAEPQPVTARRAASSANARIAFISSLYRRGRLGREDLCPKKLLLDSSLA